MKALTRILIVILGIFIGFIFTFQYQSKERLNALINLEEFDKEIENLTQLQKKLKTEIKGLQKEIELLSRNIKEKQFKNDKFYSLFQLQKEKAGLTSVSGRGVTFILKDGKGVVHAADLRDLINFLWSLEADAISINEERIVYSTSIDCIGNTILINGKNYVSPFKIKVIGNPEEISKQFTDSLLLPKDLRNRITKEEIILEIEKKKELTIAPYSGSFKLNYSKIKK